MKVVLSEQLPLGYDFNIGLLPHAYGNGKR